MLACTCVYVEKERERQRETERDREREMDRQREERKTELCKYKSGTMNVTDYTQTRHQHVVRNPGKPHQNKFTLKHQYSAELDISCDPSLDMSISFFSQDHPVGQV